MRRRWWLPVVAGIGVAVVLGVYGRLHQPPDVAVDLPFKAGLATGAALLAVLQVCSALAMYGRFPGVPPGPPLAVVHRWTGRLAMLLSLPVAIHCLYLLGFRSGDTRVLVHSLCGCLLYGAFVAKMLVLSRPENDRGWAIPIAGGTLFTAIAGAWLTSALWFFTR
ncbi:MAG TPA: DUF6529 family protein [Actinoplanes sp.]|nr:DUF6529 family protein [Actinoplanes sp.]